VNFYFLPEPTIHGGIKVGFQFAAMLRQLGIEVVIATPNGSAPQWFSSQLPVVSREKVISNLTPQDRVIFSLPYDYDELKELPARLIFHCQGTDPAIIPILQDEKVEILTCWTQAEEFVSDFSRDSENVGISVSRNFYYSGESKLPRSYATMPRRGVLLSPEKLNGFQEYQIDNMHEGAASQILKQSSGFLARSENEWFGLPSLEAMASGCIVVSPKTLGGVEYLIAGENCFVEKVENLSEQMFEVLRSEQKHQHVRQRAIEMSYRYHPRAQFKKLQKLFVSGGLKFLR
jgi:glycosyltransferase involved in cell wall biosynthesis